MKDRIRKSEDRAFIEERIIDNQKLEILYQKMGDRWFTFFLQEDELVVTSLPEEPLTPNE